MNLNRIFLPKPTLLKREWRLIDAAGKTVGRISTEIARALQGKDLEIYTPHVQTGAYIVIINAEKAVFTGDKIENKTYRKYTGYRGNVKNFTAREMLVKNPAFILETSIKRMLPKTKLGARCFDSLFVYAGPSHPHKAQIA